MCSPFPGFHSQSCSKVRVEYSKYYISTLQPVRTRGCHLKRWNILKSLCFRDLYLKKNSEKTYCCYRLTLAILKFVVFKRLELNGYRCWTWRKYSANQKDKLMQLLIIYYKHKKSQYFPSVQVRSNSKLPFRFTLLRFSSVVNLTPSFSSKNSYSFR